MMRILSLLLRTLLLPQTLREGIDCNDINKSTHDNKDVKKNYNNDNKRNEFKKEYMNEELKNSRFDYESFSEIILIFLYWFRLAVLEEFDCTISTKMRTKYIWLPVKCCFWGNSILLHVENQIVHYFLLHQ